MEQAEEFPLLALLVSVPSIFVWHPLRVVASPCSIESALLLAPFDALLHVPPFEQGLLCSESDR